jgi:hypothetical protein
MIEINLSNKKLAFIITFVYVILATIYCYSGVHIDLLHYVFFPAIIFPSLILMVESDPLILIIICQSISISLFFPFIWLIINFLRNKNKCKNN